MKKSHRFHHRKMCKRGYRRKQSRLWPMNRKDKQLLMKLNFAAGILHVHGIISQMQRDQIHRKLMKLRDKMEAKPKTEPRKP